MKKLPINHAVTFNEEAHTYTLFDGTQLSGITSIIHKFIFPSMYDGVSERVMEAARNRGHMIHKALEDCLFNGIPLFDGFEFDREVRECLGIVAENKLKPVAGEYLVSDNAHIATCIDGVFKQGKKVVLVDHKTTSVIYTEYLQWQLSIEAVLFEQQTGNKVDTLYAIHLPKNGECKLVEIDRLPDEYVNALLDAYIFGAETFENPLHKLSDDTNELLEQYKQSELALIELQASVDYHKQIQADIKARIKEQMDAESASKWENDSVTITRSKDSVRKTFKLDMLQEMAIGLPVQEWITENAPKCYTETKVNGNVTIKFK
jgi:CRISPR/Cas system-associated exonuclease Cas4 (RecB family)